MYSVRKRMGRPRKRRLVEGDGEEEERLNDDCGAFGGYGVARGGEVLQMLPLHESEGLSLSDEFLMDGFPFDFSDPLAWPFPDHDMARERQGFSGCDESQSTTSSRDNPLPNPQNPTLLPHSQIAHARPPQLERPILPFDCSSHRSSSHPKMQLHAQPLHNPLLFPNPPGPLISTDALPPPQRHYTRPQRATLPRMHQNAPIRLPKHHAPLHPPDPRCARVFQSTHTH